MIYQFLFVSAALCSLIQAAPADITEVPDHFKDILTVIPRDLITNITYEHLKTDEEFKAAVKYMQSAEWTDRVKTIREKPEWIALKKYLKGLGINIDILIRCSESFIRNVTVTVDADHPAKKSLKGFLMDVERNLPTMKILAAINEKMIKNAKLQNIFEQFSSQETRKKIDNVLVLPELKKMLKDFADMDLNIADFLSLIYSVMGWGELKLTE